MTQVTGVAESALLVPVGAALEVRDRVVGAIQPWTRRTSAEREIGRVRRDVRRFERRGTVARNRVVRELRKRRNRVVRELRKRRGQALRVARVRRNGAQRSITQNGRRPGPRRPRRDAGGPGGPAAGEPRPERASGADEAGEGPRAAVRLARQFRLPQAAGQVSVGHIWTSGPRRQKATKATSPPSAVGPFGARRSFCGQDAREPAPGGIPAANSERLRFRGVEAARQSSPRHSDREGSLRDGRSRPPAGEGVSEEIRRRALSDPSPEGGDRERTNPKPSPD